MHRCTYLHFHTCGPPGGFRTEGAGAQKGPWEGSWHARLHQQHLKTLLNLQLLSCFSGLPSLLMKFPFLSVLCRFLGWQLG